MDTNTKMRFGFEQQRSVRLYSDNRFTVPAIFMKLLKKANINEFSFGIMPEPPGCILCIPQFWSQWQSQLPELCPDFQNKRIPNLFLQPIDCRQMDSSGKMMLPRLLVKCLNIEANCDLLFIGMDYYILVYPHDTVLEFMN